MVFYTKYIANKKGFALFLVFCSALLIVACQKKDFNTKDVYENNATTDVSFTADAPQPVTVSEGTIVKYGIKGLRSKAAGTYKFYINEMEATIQEVADTYISVRIPLNASSGSASLVFNNGQICYGPGITVRGNTQIATDFISNIGTNKALKAGRAATAVITGITLMPNGNYLVYGDFDQYGNAIDLSNITSGIQMIDATGKALETSKQLAMGKRGLNGTINDAKILSDGGILLSGSFSKYDTIENVNGVARFFNDGTFDLTEYEVANSDPETHPENNTRPGSSINGGTLGSILSTFLDNAGNYITVGNYRAFSSVYYPNSTVESLQLDMITSLGLTKMDSYGVFDSSFNYKYETRQSYQGANGFVLSAVQLNSGHLLLGGTFTTFHGSNAQRLVCIDPVSGMQSNVFSGSTDGPVFRITHNKTTGSLILLGNFKHYNGIPVNGMVVVKEDGSINTGVALKAIEGGVVTYAAQLNDGRYMISGSFSKYDNIVRSGFAILNSNGSLATGYNNTGLFRGFINGHAELNTFNGVALLLVGNFDRFDNKEMGNIVKVILTNTQ
ncbi:DUF5008 domain-containing protein [Niabella sp. CJ426]|uniref:DUF5008 domain-containing protein n=1 Tax=Niabella sp. CJ426 TaxID=3393740 RepID=UPI003D06B965